MGDDVAVGCCGCGDVERVVDGDDLSFEGFEREVRVECCGVCTSGDDDDVEEVGKLGW